MDKKSISRIAEQYLEKMVEIYGYSKFQTCTPYICVEKSQKGDKAIAEYCMHLNEITLYYDKIKTVELLAASMIHEYQHYLQSPSWFERYYNMGFGYNDHPYEVAALNEEKNWKRLCKH